MTPAPARRVRLVLTTTTATRRSGRRGGASSATTATRRLGRRGASSATTTRRRGRRSGRRGRARLALSTPRSGCGGAAFDKSARSLAPSRHGGSLTCSFRSSSCFASHDRPDALAQRDRALDSFVSRRLRQMDVPIADFDRPVAVAVTLGPPLRFARRPVASIEEQRDHVRGRTLRRRRGQRCRLRARRPATTATATRRRDTRRFA